MADTIIGGPAANPEIPLGEILLPDSIPAKDSNSIISNQAPENMEVHHHPDLHHNPKKWKEYFLEFIMIFLAVTLGFFAEQLREHFVEAKVEKEYAQSLYNDLKIDTAVIQRTYNEKNWLLGKFDSAETILASNDLHTYNAFLYYVESYITFNDVFTSQDVTYQQLKNSGGFRLFRNIALYKNLSDYYNLYSRYQSVDGSLGFNSVTYATMDMESKLFNPQELSSLNNMNATNFYDLALRPEGKVFEPITPDKQALKLLYLRINTEKKRSYGSKIFLNWLKAKATELINDINKEYRLE